MSKLIDYNLIHSDDRGLMQTLFEDNIKNVSHMVSEKNTIRSNHYHLNDWHYIYVIYGTIDYFYGKIDTKLEDLNYIKVNSKKCIFTPSNEFHSTFFPERTEFLVFNNQKRDRDTYEKDLVRYNLVNHSNINFLLEKFHEKRKL